MVYLDHRILTMPYHQPVLETSDQLNHTEILSGQRCLRRCAEIQSGFCACCGSIFGVAGLKMELLQRTQEYMNMNQNYGPPKSEHVNLKQRQRYFLGSLLWDTPVNLSRFVLGVIFLEAVQLDLSGESASRPHSQVINMLGWDYILWAHFVDVNPGFSWFLFAKGLGAETLNYSFCQGFPRYRLAWHAVALTLESKRCGY